MFEINELSKKYGGEYALRDITMKISDGMNFVIGASGSGKTTLLKIITGMEGDYQGTAFFCGKDINTLTPKEQSYYYSKVFGFIWQDFNLRDDLTVIDNVMLPQYIGNTPDYKQAMKLLREMKISELAQQKAGSLSGGQKQRVAIARELMKNPTVIIADEPTSALDEKTAKSIMDILRNISKTRPVVVVTHNIELITPRDHVYELYKGGLVKADEPSSKKPATIVENRTHKLSFGNAFSIATRNIKASIPRFAIATVALLVSAILLIVTFSGTISNSTEQEFEKLFKTYGKSILDLEVVGSFMSASGTGVEEKDEPTSDVTQDISGLYERYFADERVEHIVFTQYFDDIKIKIDGKEYNIETSNNVPVISELTAGRMAADGSEVVVPQSFAKLLGQSDNDILGKTIDFSGSINNWNSGEPVKMPTSTKATIVGVMDTTVKYEYEGQVSSYTIDDAFFFSKSIVDNVRKQADVQDKASSFSIRTKTPADVIAIKDELNANGIVPLGRFELVEDMVRLNQQTQQQSGGASVVIMLLSLVIVLAVSLVTSTTRHREYAIYRVLGFSNSHISKVTFVETLITILIALIIFLPTSPIVGFATSTAWNLKLTLVGSGLLIGSGLLYYIVSVPVSLLVKPSHALKSGSR